MKINKILAAGIAATLAVTSLAAVAVPAAAEERTFNMGTSINKGTGTVKIDSFIGTAYQAVVQKQMQFVEMDLAPYVQNANGKWVMAFQHGVINGVDYGQNLSGYVSDWRAAPTLVVKGNKNNGTAADPKIVEVTREYKLQSRKINGNTVWGIAVLKDDEISYKDGEFAPSFFDEITEVTLTFPGDWSSTDETNFKNGVQPKIEGATRWPVQGMHIWALNDDGTVGAKDKDYANVYATNEGFITAEQGKADNAADKNTAAHILAYALTYGGYSPSRGMYLQPEYTFSGALELEYPVLVQTDYYKDDATDYNPDGTLKRNEVFLLSKTSQYNSGTANSTSAGNGIEAGSNGQSYNEDKYNVGTIPDKFGGLASQVADFFNKAKTGKIKIKFTAGATAATTSWTYGGIPSTEVGLKNVLGDSTKRDFALFFNYATTTGSLQAETELDLLTGEVVFDITNILTDLGGLTKGTVQDIYYGLVKGNPISDTKLKDGGYPVAKYWGDADLDNGKGAKTKINGLGVEAITLVKDEDVAADTAADAATDDKAADADIADDDDDDDDDTDVSLDDDDDDDTDVSLDDDDDDDDDDDATLTDDTDDDDDVANAEDINTPADDDANPGTGAALAVIPAIVAAAAAVVSKKRK